MNLCEIGLFHIVWGVSKGTRDNNHEIWWKCFMSKIYQYIWISGGMGGQTYSTIHFFFIIKKNGKSTRARPILKSLQNFDLKKIVGWIIKILWKGAQGGPTPISLQSEYISSNWFHSNTHNSRHLFNTNC